LADVGRRRPGYAPDLGWNLWNLIATVGAGLIACSIVLFVLNVLQSSIGGERAGPDPWDGRTLEWLIASPPPAWNFSRIPTVHGRDELWLRKDGKVKASTRLASLDGPAPEVPEPSYWPILLAGSLVVMAAGLMVSTAQIVIGGLLALACMYRFAMEHHR